MLEKTKQEKKGRIWLGFAIILVIALAAGTVWFYKERTSAKNIFRIGITEIFDYLEKNLDNNYDTASGTIGLSLNLDSDDQSLDDIESIVNNIDISGTYGVDIKNKIMSFDLETNYKNKDLLDASFYFEDSNGYVNLGSLYDKSIKVPMEEYDSLFNGITNKEDYKVVLNALEKAINNALKDEYFTTSSGKTVLTLDKAQQETVVTSIVNELKANSEFVKSYATLTNDTESNVISSLEDGLDEFKSSLTEGKVVITIYTTGIKNDFKKLEMSDSTVNVVVNKDGSKYNYEVKESNTVTANGYIETSNNGKYVVNYNAPEEGIKLTINLEYTEQYNKTIDTKDVSNSISIEDMTQEEMMEIFQKAYQNEGLVNLITAISGMM